MTGKGSVVLMKTGTSHSSRLGNITCPFQSRLLRNQKEEPTEGTFEDLLGHLEASLMQAG